MRITNSNFEQVKEIKKLWDVLSDEGQSWRDGGRKSSGMLYLGGLGMTRRILEVREGDFVLHLPDGTAFAAQGSLSEANHPP